LTLELESAWFQPMQPKCDILVSKFAFKFNLYHYTQQEEPSGYIFNRLADEGWKLKVSCPGDSNLVSVLLQQVVKFNNFFSHRVTSNIRSCSSC
jgi:hypothetical protein